MKPLLLTCLMMMFLTIALQAQAPAGTLEFDGDGVNVTNYKMSIDGAAATVVTTTTVKAPAPPVLGNFTVQIPALAAGNHSIVISACNVPTGSTGGVCSASIPFVLSVPSQPGNLRLP